MKDQGSVPIENKIRIHVEASGVRLTEFFIDYDRLRSGNVTRAQFGRVLDQMLKTSLTSEELNVLFDKYDLKNDGKVNYKEFCNNIVRAFPDKDLNNDPNNYIYKNPEYLGTFRSMKKLNQQEEDELRNLLGTLNSFCARRNMDILEKFRDYDRNNIGVVTESQFVRIMNEPPMKESELEILIRKYQHPDRKGSVNYLNFYNDIKSNPDVFKNSLGFPNGPVLSKEESGLSIQEIIDKISTASYKFGIRVHDFFKDSDGLRSGMVTDRQFITGLTNGFLKPANLCSEDIIQLSEYFKQPGGRIDYKSFCDSVENVFTIPDMEKKPLAHVVRPPRGLLNRTLNGNLSLYEEDQVATCLQTMTERVRKYKMQVFPYFKDFDRSTAFTRNVSKIQFGRVLTTLNLMPSTEMFTLLCKKFQDSVNGDINYPLFCQIVDDEYVSSIIADTEPVLEELENQEKLKSKELPLNLADIDMNELIARIRSHVLSKRIRVKEFFQDMDPLNSGTVSKDQFIRCIASFGLSSLGSFPINKSQTEALCREYIQSNDPLKCNWKKFESDLESVFTLHELEKTPNARVAPTDIFILPPPGTVAWEEEELDSAENYKTVIANLKKVVNARRLDCWPPFKDYDNLSHGHVTRKQFYQSLTKIGLHMSEKDVAILEGKFMNKKGFNYLEFLTKLQPTIVEGPKYQNLKDELDRLNTVKATYESKPVDDVQSVLRKLKDQVFRRRISIYEWLRDHDKLNSGRLLKETFRRAIDLCQLELEPSEIELIINYFCSSKDDRMVEYKAFCFEIEKAFTNDELEKNPLMEAVQHVPADPIMHNTLTPDENDSVNKSLREIAERVRQQRIQLFPRFEDFDRIKNGYVTQNQFTRVLNDLKLRTAIGPTELEYLIKKYSVRIGTRDDINYVAFNDHIYQLGSFEFRNP